MAFTHTNKITYSYTAGGVDAVKAISRSESAGAEINISKAITTNSSVETADISLDYFEFQEKDQARSVYILLTGFNGTLKGGVSGGSTMVADLKNGEPYVWSSSDGSTNNFPAGNTNPMVDATDELIVKPDAGSGTDTDGTITVRVLYAPMTP